MSVTLVEESSAGASGKVSGTGASNATSSYRTRYRVTCSSSLDTPDIVKTYFKQSNGLPYPGRPFDFGNGYDNKATCKELTFDMVDKSEGRFLVEASFEEQQSSGESQSTDGKPSDSPFKWHDELDISTTQISVPVTGATFKGAINMNGFPVNCILPFNKLMPVQNSAFVPLDPGIDEELDILIFRLTKYQPAYNAGFLNNYLGTVNAHAFAIHKPAYNFIVNVAERVAKMKAISSSFAITDKGIKYWRHTLEVHINRQGWRRRLLDQGIEERYVQGVDTKLPNGDTLSASDYPTLPNGTVANDMLIPVKDSTDDTPINSPIPFNGFGHKKTSRTAPNVVLVYQTLPEVDWSGIQW